MTTMTYGSALQSARGNIFLNDQPGQVNLESTAELKAFATIDISKITNERTAQLQYALEENVREKEKEFEQASLSFD